MKLNLSQLEEMFQEIKEIINFIELSQYENRRNRIYLSNGDRINFSLPNESIAHLLGINTNYLISTGIFDSTNSFTLLKMLCENAYKINNLSNKNIINQDCLFSTFIQEKIAIFKENIKINTEETELVCKYDSSRAYLTNKLSEKYDYIIIKKLSDGKFGILGLINNGSYYIPMSNQIFDNFEEAKETLNRYLRNQEVALITGVNYFNTQSDYDRTFYLSLNNKVEKVKNIKNYKELFNCSLDLSYDYEYSIKRIKENKNNQFEDNDIINIIVDCIKSGKLIDTKIFRDSNLSKIIESFNDRLCNTQVNNNNSISETYTNIKNQLEHLKSELKEAKEKNDVLKEKNEGLTQLVKTLDAENKEFKETNEMILKLLNKKPRM